jgi:hypothetical protein
LPKILLLLLLRGEKLCQVMPFLVFPEWTGKIRESALIQHSLA